MTDLEFGGRPRLPDNPDYWETLAERIETGAAPLFERSAPTRIWWGRRAVTPALAASALVASLAAWLWLPQNPRVGVTDGQVVNAAVRPADPIAALLSGATPPTVESLLGAEAARVVETEEN